MHKASFLNLLSNLELDSILFGDSHLEASLILINDCKNQVIGIKKKTYYILYTNSYKQKGLPFIEFFFMTESGGKQTSLSDIRLPGGSNPSDRNIHNEESIKNLKLNDKGTGAPCGNPNDCTCGLCNIEKEYKKVLTLAALSD